MVERVAIVKISHWAGDTCHIHDRVPMTATVPRARRIFRFLLLGMASSGVLATAIGFFGDWHWYADLFAHLRPQYCIWLALAFVGAVVGRCRAALVLAVVGLIGNAVALAPYAMPWREEGGAVKTGKVRTFVSLNLLHGNQDAQAVMAYLRSVNADVVVFQETSPRWESALEPLADLYPHRFSQARKDNFGVALFCREKPTEVSIRAVGNRVGDLGVFATWEDGGRRFGLAGVHPDKPDEEWKTVNRRVYLDNIAKWSAEQARGGVPVVVLGDFNATPWSASMRRFARETGLRNTSQGVIFGATWNVRQPHRLLIDHAFLSGHWTLTGRQVGPHVGSDHRPLLIRAALRHE